MDEKAEKTEQRIVMTIPDYNLVVGYLRSTLLPYKDTEVIFEALKRSVAMNITLKDENSKE